MARMLNLANVLQLVVDGLNDRSFSQQDFVDELDETLLHVLAGFGHQLQSAIVELLEQLLTDVTSVAEELTQSALSHFWHRLAVVGVCGRELKCQQFATRVDNQVQFEAKLPSG